MVMVKRDYMVQVLMSRSAGLYCAFYLAVHFYVLPVARLVVRIYTIIICIVGCTSSFVSLAFGTGQ
jgi:hypothetical protein